MKILISGGHLTPSLAFIDYVKKHNPKDEVIFIGRTHSRRKLKQESRERHETEKRAIKFIAFNSSKLSKNTIIEKIKSFPMLFVATIRAIGILIRIKPDVFVSFGGFLAVPITFASWIMRVPIITHEQTRTAGVANKMIARFANKIAVSYRESIKYFPKKRTFLTGNMIRENILADGYPRPTWLKTSSQKPILYVTGGSQGSEIINHTLSQIVRVLTKDWLVVHQCGHPTGKRNYKKELDEIKKALPKINRSNYFAREWLDEEELSWIYSNAKAIVSRAGANTTEEIATRGVPSVLIPLPFSHNQEQLKNAQALSNNKQAVLLEQKYLNPETLLESINLVNKYNRKFSRNLKMFARPKNPDKKFYNLVKKIANSKK